MSSGKTQVSKSRVLTRLFLYNVSLSSNCPETALAAILLLWFSKLSFPNLPLCSLWHLPLRIVSCHNEKGTLYFFGKNHFKTRMCKVTYG